MISIGMLIRLQEELLKKLIKLNETKTNLQSTANVIDYIGFREARPDNEKKSTDPRFAAGLYLFQKQKRHLNGSQCLARLCALLYERMNMNKTLDKSFLRR
jgi:hypothetical protein